MILLKRGKFIGTDIDPICLQTEISQILETNSRQCLNPESDVTGTVQAIGVARTLIKEVY